MAAPRTYAFEVSRALGTLFISRAWGDAREGSTRMDVPDAPLSFEVLAFSPRELPAASRAAAQSLHDRCGSV